MPFNDRVESTSKLINCTGDLIKLVGVIALVGFAVRAIAEPDWAKSTLAGMGIHVQEINVGVVKLKLTEASGNVLDVAGALNKAEAALLLAMDGSATTPAARQQVEDAKTAIDAGRAHLAKQAAVIEAAGNQAGLVRDVPKDGWLFYGLAGEDGSVKMVAPTMGSRESAPKNVKELSTVKLTRDAVLSTDAIACTPSMKLEDVSSPTPQQMAKPLAMLAGGADAAALQVTAQKQCVRRGSLFEVWVRVDVPEKQVRFTTLAELNGKPR